MTASLTTDEEHGTTSRHHLTDDAGRRQFSGEAHHTSDIENIPLVYNPNCGFLWQWQTFIRRPFSTANVVAGLALILTAVLGASAWYYAWVSLQWTQLGICYDHPELSDLATCQRLRTAVDHGSHKLPRRFLASRQPPSWYVLASRQSSNRYPDIEDRDRADFDVLREGIRRQGDARIMYDAMESYQLDVGIPKAWRLSSGLWGISLDGSIVEYLYLGTEYWENCLKARPKCESSGCVSVMHSTKREL